MTCGRRQDLPAATATASRDPQGAVALPHDVGEVDQVRRRLDHSSSAARQAEAPTLTRRRDRVFVAAAVALRSHEAVFKAPAAPGSALKLTGEGKRVSDASYNQPRS